jgi:hypothetical protein
MSYDLKYQSDFYNIYEKLVSVKIYKKDYGSHDPILLRTSEVIIEVNYQDENTPIIGTGVKVNIINTGEFDSLEDLLTSLEKQFYCTIEYNSVIVFRGFSLCDLNEQQFLPWARITIQFTDYLRRLESDQAVLLDTIGTPSNLLSLIRNALVVIMGVDNPIPVYINSTLFESTMNATADDTCLEQIWVENDIFYSNTTDHDNTYDAINKILLSLGAYLYSYGASWYIERQEDVLRTGNWVSYPNFVNSVIDGASLTSLKQEYNKQDGDFEYTDESQIIEYDSGLQKLIFNLQDKKFDTFVFNDFTTNMNQVSNKTPDAGSLSLHTWYAHTSVTQVAVGYSFRGMSKYFKWTYDASNTTYDTEGLYYNFEVTFNKSEEVPTELSISYKMSGEYDLSTVRAVRIYFYLRVDGGTKSDYYLGLRPGPGDVWFLGFGDNTSDMLENYEDFDVSINPDKTWTISKTFNLSDDILVEQPNNLPPSAIPSIWQQLGNPESQKFTIMFFPTMLIYKGISQPPFGFNKVNYIGDIEVTITQQEILNKLTYYVNRDFIKTDTVDINFFDLSNKNFSNGFLTGTYPSFTKTALWTSQWNVSNSKPLMDILAADRFRKYYHTVHKLKATIMFDGHLKPFTVLTDDQLWAGSSDEAMKLMINSYVWDLNNGTYDIETVEYTDEEMTFDEASEATVPTGLTVTQPDAGDHMLIEWDAIAGVTGYILQRQPYSYNPAYQIASWITVYVGTDEAFDDHIEAEPYVMTGNTTISYRICAYVASGTTAYSTIVTGTWYPSS